MNFLDQHTNLEGKRVLVRTDLNVPLEDGTVKDDTRIRSAVPTIEYLVEQGAIVILMAHLGRPKGEVVEELRMAPVAARLSEFLDEDVTVLQQDLWWSVRNLKPGSVVLLENMRFFLGEAENDPDFVESLAALGELFVFDGFGVAHRDTASVTGVPKLLPHCAGLLVKKELAALDALKKTPKAPIVLLIGGAKIETKLPVIESFVDEADHVILGGALVNTVLNRIGYGVGGSRVDDISVEVLTSLKNPSVLLPSDVVVGKSDGTGVRAVQLGASPHEICGPDESIFDMGPQSVANAQKLIAKANTIIMNGAVGVFEQEPYDAGTRAITQAVAQRSDAGAYTVIGGGETVQLAQEIGATSHINLVSTGGGAMLAYLGGEKLPGLEAINIR